MYETEVNGRVESSSQIPNEILKKFGELTDLIAAKTLLLWSEGCTECVAPACYATCSLYSPREDLKCRRFMDGMVRIEDADIASGFLLKLRFKRWGQLWTYANTHLYPVSTAQRLEKRDQLIGSAIFHAPVPRRLKRYAISQRYTHKKQQILARSVSPERPNCFILECYNPQDRTIDLSLTMIPSDPNVKIRFQRLIPLHPGFTRERILISEISRAIDLGTRFYISIIPNGLDDIEDGTTLYFGLIDFVQDVSFRPVANAPKVKCVVWDLDNTLWEGILVEDGAANLRIKPRVVEIIKELDRRGILHSVASKNNYDEAFAVLQQFGLNDYVLHPQISWGPKSAALKRIARALNIGLDSLLFVDDSEFDRSEVRSALPEVRVVDPSESLSLLHRPDCDVPITTESLARRKMYQEAGVRAAAAEEFGDDYMSFLRDCRIRLRISALSEANLERVHELTQRTNQMNFSGNLYSRDVLTDIMHSPHLNTYVLECRDRFGSYGTIGFCIVDSTIPLVSDLMFSCRVQSKRIEHAFLTYLLRELIPTIGKDCYFRYKKTARNAAAGEVFDHFGMEIVEQLDGVTRLVFRRNRTIPDDRLIEVVADPSVQLQHA